MAKKINWKSIVKNVAPVLGTALGGPLAGVAVKAIADNVFGNPEMTEEEIAEQLSSASPETLLKLREADQRFKVDMKKLDVDVYGLEVKDRDSARQMFQRLPGAQIVLSTVFIGGYFGVFYYVFTETPTESPGPVITTLIGTLTASVIQIMNFWFGSSLGSSRKTDILANGQKG